LQMFPIETRAPVGHTEFPSLLWIRLPRRCAMVKATTHGVGRNLDRERGSQGQPTFGGCRPHHPGADGGEVTPLPRLAVCKIAHVARSSDPICRKRRQRKNVAKIPAVTRIFNSLENIHCASRREDLPQCLQLSRPPYASPEQFILSSRCLEQQFQMIARPGSEPIGISSTAFAPGTR
jgi:hypothetical protein